MSDLDKRLRAIYSRANRELTEKVNSFFERFEEADKKHRALVEEGKLSEKEYQKWRINTLMTGERYKQMQKDVADTLLNVNKVAASYINAEMPGVYASNFNRVGKDASKQVPGYSFDLVSAQTVRKLASEDKTLLPYKYVDGRKDERWNTKKVNGEILQGIIQGESIPKIAKRLGNVTEMNKESAIRNARTAITGAQNSGRFDGMKQLEDDGVILKKEWVAAVDSHTREAHLELNGQQVDIDKPFVVDGKEIMFPGDPDCPYPELVYNCRCTMRTVVVGFKRPDIPIEEEREPSSPAKESSYKNAMVGAESPVELWMNMTEEQQTEFMASGLNINDVYAELKKEIGETVQKEWKDANPGGAASFSIEHDFSRQNVKFVQIKPKSAGWMADANGLGTINIREGGLGEDWDFIIGHEAGHQLANSSSELQSLIIENPGDVFGRFNIRLMAFDGVYGEYNPEEAFATCVSNYIRHGESMKQKYPDAYAAIDNLFKKSPSAREFVVRTMDEYRRLFR